MAQQAEQWDQWSGRMDWRMGQAESRIQSVQDLSIEWSTWAFRITEQLGQIRYSMTQMNGRMDTMEQSILSLSSDVALIKAHVLGGGENK